ncbi:hypothetical protein ACFU93_37020 [Streptomyces sp. NPDC057611]|uniref:hypothetical protein n=1 Tax=Streptomyces sp. NPDC057611 TaxID=3346182 RepID=UPI0036952B0C
MDDMDDMDDMETSPLRDHPERFAAWHACVARQLDAGRSAADLQDDEYRSWAYEVYCQHGEIPEAAFADHLHLRQLRLSERALKCLADRDLRSGGPGEAPEPYAESPGEQFPTGLVNVGDERIGSFLWQEIVADVGRGGQAHVAEARGKLWPVCPEHGRGLHAAATGGRAGWWCLATDHLVAWVLDPDPAPDPSAPDHLLR